MSAKLQEIEGTFRHEIYRAGDFVIGQIELPSNGKPGGHLTIKGDAGADELEWDGRYRFYGKFANWTNKRTGESERQFQFQTFVSAVSHDRHGIVQYLIRAGKGLGLGKATANKLFDLHGSDAVKVAREKPETLTRLSHTITAKKAAAIAENLASQKATEDATIDLTNLLAGRGLPKAIPRKAIKEWGNRAASVVRKDPYSLMRFHGCGFKLCDALWIELGHRPDRLKRQSLCAWNAVASNSDGHTWFPVNHVVDSVRQNIGGSRAKPTKAIKLALRLGQLSPSHYGALSRTRTNQHHVIDNAGKSLWIAENKKAILESDLAEMVSNAVHETSWAWPNVDDIDGIDEHQRSTLAKALTKPVAILGGGPGTGKTYATAQLIRYLLNEGVVGPDDIAIGAPTGKAAVRITEAMQAAGVKIRARTWHSLLGFGVASSEEQDQQFLYSKKNLWPFRILIGDEWSMLDTGLMRSIFAARPPGCHVLMVGDVNQLPPVGSGAPLRDLINSQCVGFGELTEIKRNSGGIVEACKAIRQGKPWKQGDNLRIIDKGSPFELVDEQLRAAKKDGLDPIWDCQVLVAVNTKSKLSRKVVNQYLQDKWNSNPKVQGTPFRLDDKIVCLKNGKYTIAQNSVDWDNETAEEAGDDVYVANGELAKVIAIEEKVIIAELSSPKRIIRIPRGKAGKDESGNESSGCNWDLAYGLSCHKSQGSEWPVVIVLLDEYPGARRVCSREWIYTAISRAKSLCVLIGKKSTADAMCRRVAIGKRKTFLRELVQLNVGNRTLETI